MPTPDQSTPRELIAARLVASVMSPEGLHIAHTAAQLMESERLSVAQAILAAAEMGLHQGRKQAMEARKC